MTTTASTPDTTESFADVSLNESTGVIPPSSPALRPQSHKPPTSVLRRVSILCVTILCAAAGGSSATYTLIVGARVELGPVQGVPTNLGYSASSGGGSLALLDIMALVGLAGLSRARSRLDAAASSSDFSDASRCRSDRRRRHEKASPRRRAAQRAASSPAARSP
jgi:hypothetical protein